MLWAEAWTLPELGSFAITHATLPGTVKVKDLASGIGRGSVTVPADWSGLDSLLSTSGGSLIRVCRRDATGGRQIVFEFTPETSTAKHGEPSKKPVTLTGQSIEGKLDHAAVLTHDWPTTPTKDPDWKWGYSTLLSTQNQGFEANPYSLVNPDAEDGSTDGWPTTGTRAEAIAPETFEAIEGAGADTGDWYFNITADAGEGIYQNFTKPLVEGETYIVSCRLYVATGATTRMEVTDAASVSVGSLFNGAAYADAVGNDAYQTVTVTFVAGAATGGISILSQTAANTFRVDNVLAEGYGIGTDDWTVRGTVDVFAVVPSTTVPAPPVHGGTYSLAWHPNSGVSGNDSLILSQASTVGEQITGSIWVYHTEGADRDLRLVLRIPGVNPNTQNVASVSATVATATWTQIVASGVATTTTTELELRYDETGAPVNNIYVDDADFFTGQAAATLGAIVGQLLTDVQTGHTAEANDFDVEQLTWLKKDFSDTVDSNADSWAESLALTVPAGLTFGQVMDRVSRLGYEWRIVPNSAFPAVDTESHLLQLFNPWNAATFAGGAGTDKTASVKLTSGQAILDGPVKRTELSRTVAFAIDPDGNIAVSRDATGEGVWGQRVTGSRETNIFDDTSLQTVADQVITDRAQTVTASKIRFLEGQTVPYLDFEPGDTITFGLPPDLIDGSHRVAVVEYDVDGPDTPWKVGFDRNTYTGLSGTVQAVDRLLRRTTDPKVSPDPEPVTVASDGVTATVIPTFLVAASDATTAERKAADYVCGGTNDQIEIQTAFDALPTVGGRVVLTAGTYDIAIDGASGVAITMGTNDSLVGVGKSTILNMSGNSASHQTGIQVATDGTLSDMEINIAGNTNGDLDVIYVSGSRAVVRNMYVRGLDGTLGDVAYLVVNGFDCFIENNYLTSSTSTPTTNRLLVIQGNEATVVGNICRGSTNVPAYEVTSAQRVTTTGNFFSSDGVIIKDSFQTFTGNSVNLVGTAGFQITGASNVTVTGNSITGSGNTVELSGTILGLVISGNDLSILDGIQFLDGIALQEFTISDNVFEGGSGITTAALSTSITILNGSIVGNSLHTAGGSQRISVGATGADVRDVTIAQNGIKHGSTNPTLPAIYVGTTDNEPGTISIQGNEIEQQVSSVHAYGVEVETDSVGTWPSNVTVVDNFLHGTGGIRVVGFRHITVTDNVLPHPYGLAMTAADEDYVAHQIEVDALEYAVVSNNVAGAGNYGDKTGTTAVIAVTAVNGGRVSDNDVTGNDVGLLDTAFLIDGPLHIVANRYHGVGPGWAAAETPFSNEIVVVGTGAIIGDNGSVVDVSGATTPTYSSVVTTKGDLFGFDTEPARLPVGADGTHLASDSTAALGVAWKINGEWNGSFVESMTTTVTESAGTVTAALEQSGGGDLTMRFSDGHTILDTTPAVTIALTTGSDTAPQANYIYILQTGKVLAKSTTAWPTTEHIKVAYFLVPSATFVAADGVYVHQNWNDHETGTDDEGHMQHIAERVRRIAASYFSGLTGAGTSDYLTLAGTTVDLKIASGVVYQLHRHTVAAFDTSAGDVVLVKNWSGDAYHNITNMYDIVADSTGTTIANNRYFNIVVWGVANQTGVYSPVMVNLPSGTYTSQAGAEADLSGYDDFTMPRDFNLDSSTGFLICRLTVQKKATAWEYKSTSDLRGTTPQTASGGAAGVTTAFADNQFTVFNVTDTTKIVDLDVSAVTTATTRTWTVEDVDGSVAVLNTVALGGGAAPTLGTIGGSGPATAAQNAWGQVDIAGTTYWVPLWL